ncbi:MAG: glycosyltransferase family 2 protein, partial [Bacteroidota bacterium]
MSKPITAFLPFGGNDFTRATVNQLEQSGLVEKILLLTAGESGMRIDGCEMLEVRSLLGSETFQLVAEKLTTPYALILIHDTLIDFGQFALERFLSVAENTGAGLLYSDYYDMREGKRIPHPVIDYQLGSIRDDFNFGSVLFLKSAVVQESITELGPTDYNFAGLYALRLAVSRRSAITRIAEYLYSK